MPGRTAATTLLVAAQPPTAMVRPARSGAESRCTGIKLRLTTPAELPLQARQPPPQPARTARRALRRRRPRPMEPRTSRQGKSQAPRSEEHTSELQSPCNLVCRLLLEKKKED